MRFLGEGQPIVDDDGAIRAAVQDAEMPPLLAAVAHLTGDDSLLREHLAPDPLRNLEENAGLTAEQMAEGRELAAEALIRHRDAGNPPPPPVTAEQLDVLLGFLVADAGTGDYRELLEEELALEGDRRAPTWTKADVDADRPFRVAIIGAGMSGLVAAHRLAQAGVDYVILEKDADVGGTWFENVYPGCRVDVPNHFYSYSFAQSGEWPGFFSTQEALLDYFRVCADEFGIRPHIRFDTEVERCTWDDEAEQWVVRTAAGEERFDVVVSAVGQLNRPSFPDIPGRDAYQGEWFHSARWRHDIDLRRQAGGGDRHRVQRGPVHPDRGRGGRRAADLPAHPALALRDAELPRRAASRHAVGAAARAVLRPVGSPLAVLAHPRGPAAGRRGRPGVGSR